MYRRLAFVPLWVSMCLFSWLAMMIAHECGHVMHAWMTGGTVVKVVLHPLSLSRTDVHPNPHPHFVVWGGPIWGCVLPAAFLGVARLCRLPFAYLFAFFAGFCFVANGAYLVAAVWFPVGDTAELLEFRWPRWVLVAFGVSAIATGFRLWNGLGTFFGIADSHATVDRKATCFVSLAVVLIVAVEFAISDPI